MSEDPKKSLGEFLKSERERRGLTIEQTSSATKIGLKILRQLEADQYADLPALPFVRGFIRNYGKFLGLDGEKLLAEYAGFLDTHAGERPKRDAGHSGYAFERPEGEQSRKILWGVMAGMLIFGGAVVFIFKPSLKHKHHDHIDKMKPGGESDSSDETIPGVEPSGVPLVEASATPAPSPLPSSTPSVAAVSKPEPSKAIPRPSPSVTPTPKPTPISSEAPVSKPEDDQKQDPLQSGTNYKAKEIRTKLVLRTKADVWVRYRCDDKQLMKFALKKDKILVLRGKTSVYLQVSNPDSITLQAPGQEEVLFSQSSVAFDYHGNSTVVFPAQARDKIEENFKIGPPLPRTDSSLPVQ